MKLLLLIFCGLVLLVFGPQDEIVPEPPAILGLR